VAEHDNQQSNVTNQMNARPMPKNEASELVVQTFPRRLDIADVESQRGVEYKTGYQSASEANLWELSRDAWMVENRGWSIEWVFTERPSQPLLDALNRAGIEYRIGG
jgi:hypothetical protein